MLEFRFPIAGDPLAGGELIRYGFGVSHLWYDTDTIAIITAPRVSKWTGTSPGPIY